MREKKYLVRADGIVGHRIIFAKSMMHAIKNVTGRMSIRYLWAPGYVEFRFNGSTFHVMEAL